MKLLTSKHQWNTWLSSTLGAMAHHEFEPPKSYPCYVYADIDPLALDARKAFILYRRDLENMASQLVSLEGMRV